MLLLWDFHVVAALERWRRTHGQAMPQRFEALAELEALSSFATLAYENPDWAFPQVGVTYHEIRATKLAHPFLPSASRVSNDVVVGPAGTFVLVTGSNMSGKSTLLRAVGLNAVLAQVGAPVCAASLVMPRVRIRTIIHVRDSIGDGTSLFKAELLRIRDTVRAAHITTDPMILYLADEMLHGTNVDDQRVATIAIVKALAQLGAIGIIATHLDGLLDDPAIAAMAHPIHFTEMYESSNESLRMSFDYRVRPGLATSRNALALVRMIALEGVAMDGLPAAK
jgi:DNA mismatch repair ATPase MutS